MNKKLFIKKDNNNLPDFYVLNIEFITGKKEEIKIVSHKFVGNNQDKVELITVEDEFILLPFSNIVSIKFDKNFSKIVELREKQRDKK
jgi:hypothetical protein